MDWAIITRTIEHLHTLEPEELAAELQALGQDDPELLKQVTGLIGTRNDAASFMQTSMPRTDHFESQSLESGSTIGVWKINTLLGSGGMGEVYRALRADGLFEQQVALKLAKAKGAEIRERFDAERQRLAQLEHPNIARIVDGGATDDGAPYMTMEFVDGHPIQAFCVEKRLGRNERLGLIDKLCAAVAHAHGRLVLHRDIKHDNVLINQEGELRLIDFGVASLLDDTGEDATGGPLTIAYAAPEQLRSEPVSAATDIFAIGMLAHLLVTEKLPQRQSEGGVAVDRASLGSDDLAAILAKATADSPEDRYASADALRDDLQKWVGGFPVAARPVSSIARFRKLVARNKLASAMSGAAIAALIAGVIGVSVFAIEANEERERYRISELEAASLVEVNENFTAGFSLMAAQIDFETPRGQQFLSFLQDAERYATSQMAEDPEEAYAILSFLGEFYGNQYLTEDKVRVSALIAKPEIPMSYSKARDLLEAGYAINDPDQFPLALQYLDQAESYLAKNIDIHDHDLVLAACYRSRKTAEPDDQRSCMKRALGFVEIHGAVSSQHAANNLVFLAYAADSAISLEDPARTKEIATSALALYDNVNETTASVPKAAFYLHFAKASVLLKEFEGARDSLEEAKEGVVGVQGMHYFEVPIRNQLASVLLRLDEPEQARSDARAALELSQKTMGPNNPSSVAAKVWSARSEHASGSTEEAIRLMSEVISSLAEVEGSSGKLEEYTKDLDSWRAQVSGQN